VPSEQTFADVTRWKADKPKNKQGAWSYAAEAFGFNNHDIRREFADLTWIETEGICAWGNWRAENRSGWVADARGLEVSIVE